MFPDIYRNFTGTFINIDRCSNLENIQFSDQMSTNKEKILRKWTWIRILDHWASQKLLKLPFSEFDSGLWLPFLIGNFEKEERALITTYPSHNDVWILIMPHIIAHIFYLGKNLQMIFEVNFLDSTLLCTIYLESIKMKNRQKTPSVSWNNQILCITWQKNSRMAPQISTL